MTAAKTPPTPEPDDVEAAEELPEYYNSTFAERAKAAGANKRVAAGRGK